MLEFSNLWGNVRVADNRIDFKVNYKNLDVIKEFNTEKIDFPVVLASPHSGQLFPHEFLESVKMGVDKLRSNEDSFVDELVLPASSAGIPLIALNIARAFIDVNRDKIEIDPQMYYNYPQTDDIKAGIRCRVGLGVIHRINAERENIYNGLLNFDEVKERISKVYDVYHDHLQALISKVSRKFGYCFVIDCHSMPSKICSLMQDDRPIDFCLGTLFEQSCPTQVSEFLSKSLESKGFKVAMNCPYSGAFTTFNYCQPRKNIYTLQIEMNRSLYMEENVHKKNANFQSFSTEISASITALAKFLLDFKK